MLYTSYNEIYFIDRRKIVKIYLTSFENIFNNGLRRDKDFLDIHVYGIN